MAARALLRRCGAASATIFGRPRAENVADARAHLRSALIWAQRDSAANSTITSSSFSSWEMLESPRSGSRSSGSSGPSTAYSSVAPHSQLMGWLLAEKPRFWVLEFCSFPSATFSSSVGLFSPSRPSIPSSYSTARHFTNLRLEMRRPRFGSHQQATNSSTSLRSAAIGGAFFSWGPVSATSADVKMVQSQMQQTRSLSKLKSYKMKRYSSYKERFKLMADGTFKRWRSGTRHNAKSKTPKQRRQLRRPSTAPAALAKVMKKLNFVR